MVDYKSTVHMISKDFKRITNNIDIAFYRVDAAFTIKGAYHVGSKRKKRKKAEINTAYKGIRLPLLRVSS